MKRGCLYTVILSLILWTAILTIWTLVARAAEPEPVEVIIRVVHEYKPAEDDASEVIGIQCLAGVDPDMLLDLSEEEMEPELVSLGTYKITGYCACEKCCGKDPDDPLYGITATGTVATEGRTIAADPSVLPYGTVVYIDGQAYVVEDCGGAIKGNEIDLYFDSHEAAREWGVQEREVFVYGK